MSESQQFVDNAHGDIDAVRTALAGEPPLVNCAWDWCRRRRRAACA